jgi:hypothetical protein
VHGWDDLVHEEREVLYARAAVELQKRVELPGAAPRIRGDEGEAACVPGLATIDSIACSPTATCPEE